MSRRIAIHCLVLSAHLALAGVAGADSVYTFSVNTATSTLAADVSASAPIAGNLQGNTDATPPTRTKTPPLNLFVCGIVDGENDLLPITSTLVVAGSAGEGAQPSGTFTLGIDTVALTSFSRGLSLDLLGEATLSIAATLDNLSLPAFCTVNPSCNIPISLTFDLPLGNVTLVGMQVAQDPGDAAGTLIANPNGGWDFAIPMTALVTTQLTFQGEPFPSDPQPVALVFAGTITTSGDNASIITNIVVDLAPPPSETPVEIPATALPPTTGLPICNGMNLLMSGTVSNVAIDVHATAALAAAGTRTLCRCDWNHNGQVSVQDLFDFLASFFGGNADFNGVGGTTTQDLFDFLTCWFSRPPECQA